MCCQGSRWLWLLPAGLRSSWPTHMLVQTDRSIDEKTGEVLVQVLPGQGQVMAVELHGFSIVVQVEVSIAQLTVDSTQHLQVLCANLDGRLKEGDTRPEITGFTEPLTLQRQLQAGRLHPTAEKSPVSLKVRNQDKIKLESQREAPEILLWVQPTANCLDSSSKDSFQAFNRECCLSSCQPLKTMAHSPVCL